MFLRFLIQTLSKENCYRCSCATMHKIDTSNTNPKQKHRWDPGLDLISFRISFTSPSSKATDKMADGLKLSLGTRDNQIQHIIELETASVKYTTTASCGFHSCDLYNEIQGSWHFMTFHDGYDPGHFHCNGSSTSCSSIPDGSDGTKIFGLRVEHGSDMVTLSCWQVTWHERFEPRTTGNPICSESERTWHWSLQTLIGFESLSGLSQRGIKGSECKLSTFTTSFAILFSKKWSHKSIYHF